MTRPISPWRVQSSSITAHAGVSREVAPRTFRRLSLVATLSCLALVSGARAGAAGQGRTPPSEGVALVRQDGGFIVSTPAYRAVIGGDGNLHSFRVGEAEMLDDRVGLSLGAFYYSNLPLKLPRISLSSRTTVEATDDGHHLLRYRFTVNQAAITLVNRSATSTSYFVVLSPEITIVRNPQTGEAAASPANANWPNALFYTRAGEYLALRGGTRVWGPWLDRQVWEVAEVPAEGGQVQIVLEGGKGQQPKATLEQLLGVKAAVALAEGRPARLRGVELTAEVDNRADETLEGTVSMELSSSRSDLVILASRPLTLHPKQTAQTSFEAHVETPDFYTARISVSAKGRQVAKTMAVAGYRVEDIVPIPNHPPGFQEFWQRLLAEAQANEAELQLQLTPSAAKSRGDLRVALAQYPGMGGKTIYGWYLAPALPGKYPALLYLSGYGARDITPPTFLAQKGYAVLAINVRGAPVDKPRVKSYDDYLTVGISSPDTYVYREIVGHALRGLWALAKREEADPDRMGVVGVSEGGGLGLILAALEPRVRAVSADAPMLADFPLSARRAMWPYKRINQYLQEHPEQAAQVGTTLAYFDLVNLAGEVKCPALVSVGFLDQVSLPAAVYGMYNLLGGPKELRAFPRAGHEGGGQDWWTYKLAWLEKQLAPRPAPTPTPAPPTTQRPAPIPSSPPAAPLSPQVAPPPTPQPAP